MRIGLVIAGVAAVGISLQGCAVPRAAATCVTRPAVCAVIGAAAVGGAIAIGAVARNGVSLPIPSDVRLKRNVRYVETLENGLRLYAFRYDGDSRVFVGVLAQDLLADPRFSGAAHQDPSGYWIVDFNALGLELVAADQMQAAAAGALARAPRL